MFVEQLRRAVEASSRAELPTVSALLWKAYAAGTVSESDAQALSDLIEARRALPAAQKPTQRHFGSRPKQSCAACPTDAVRLTPATQRSASHAIRGSASGNLLRTPASMERRRRWAASGALPPALASRFTLAEQS